jgi:hypothetical protein
VRTPEVRRVRTDTLLRMIEEHGRVDVDLLQAFHESRHPDGWIWSVAMQHDVAATRSLSRIHVTAERARFTYTPGRPGDVEALAPVEIPVLR